MVTVVTQRFDALSTANDHRGRRAELKHALKTGERTIEEVLLESEPWLFSVPVCELLMWAPRIGAFRRNRILRRADVWPLRAVGALTSRQRLRIVAEVRACVRSGGS